MFWIFSIRSESAERNSIALTPTFIQQNYNMNYLVSDSEQIHLSSLHNNPEMNIVCTVC